MVVHGMGMEGGRVFNDLFVGNPALNVGAGILHVVTAVVITVAMLRFSLGLLQTAYLLVMTTARITSLVMDLLSGGVITCTILTHS